MQALRFSVATWCCACVAVCFLWASPGYSASLSSEYNKAYQAFKSLRNSSKRAKYRSNWKALESRFVKVYKRAPSSSYAPKALYYAGRVNEELGKRSYLASDFRAAVDYFGRAAAKFPRHSWSDDCLYRKANISYTYLKDSKSARKDLNTILKHYTRGDMYNKALALHRKVLAKPTSSSSSKVVTKQRTSPNKKSASAANFTGSLAKLNDIRFQSSSEYTRVVLDLSKGVKFQYHILAADRSKGKPFRLYVDLTGATFDNSLKKEFRVGDGILRQVRAGKPSSTTTRVVLDFEAVQKYNVFALDNPFRVVVDVSAPKGGAKLPSVASKQQTARKVSKPKAKKWTPPKGSKAQVGELIEQLGLTVKTIMIDAGHGGKDPGAQGNGIREKDYVLKMAKKVGDRLKAKGFTVLYTRTKNVFVPLEERTAMSNVRKADLFLSLHINANRSSRVNGLETYYLNLARSKSAVRVAARENAVSEKRISDLQFILTDLMLNSKVQESKDLAKLIQKNMYGTVKRYNYSTKDNGVRSAPFYVLMGAKMPAVLVELGYCTNKREAKRLKSDKYLNRLADGIVKGVDAYRKQLSRYASL